MKKLKLAPDNRMSTTHADERGTVVVKIFLAAKGHRPVKGNIQKTARFADAKVSEVATAILGLAKHES